MRARVGKMQFRELFSVLRFDEELDLVIYHADSTAEPDEHYVALTPDQWRRVAMYLKTQSWQEEFTAPARKD